MSEPDDLSTLLSSLLELLPFDDAAAASLGSPFDIETLAATSDLGASLDETQLDLGEGPSWQAFHSHRPIAVPFVDGDAAAGWPFYASALAGVGIRSVLALPLSFGPLHIGAITLFSATSAQASTESLQLAKSIATLLGRTVIARALADAHAGTASRDPSLSRREVHQATGMIISQTKTTPADALLLLRAHAFRTSRTVRAVAADIVACRLDLSPGPSHSPDPDH
ncbi:GAF and ANTAR domain-containing protein [Rathayibacter sp. VKM Ac-2927]|uniref:GAF and ANTAR domain-containing protein n=1 Tax=Rathayibacter sp. VKM Ac-2927 TaxID=2929478 RepID=UPI001FB27FA7|nr:GAF and ANTAR domain-containing protein [Rathayibacter sp. VKM Ac-2927]MCJ1688484.1 GAF and ANTAR domain-containing protein [Rathayibacter sp. VKM Ac-2927]